MSNKQTIEELQKTFGISVEKSNQNYELVSRYIDNHKFNSLINNKEAYTKQDYYVIFPKYMSIKNLSDELCANRDAKIQKSGKALNGVVTIFFNEKMYKPLDLIAENCDMIYNQILRLVFMLATR